MDGVRAQVEPQPKFLCSFNFEHSQIYDRIEFFALLNIDRIIGFGVGVQDPRKRLDSYLVCAFCEIAAFLRRLNICIF